MLITQSSRRPLASWKALLRRSRQQNELLLLRSMVTDTKRTRRTTTTTTPESTRTAAAEATAAPPPIPPPSPAAIPKTKPRLHVIRANKSNQPTRPSAIRTAFAVYPAAPTARAAHPAVLMSYHAQQVRRLDPSGARTALFARGRRDAAKPGDVLQVTTARGGGGEPFAGVCLAVRRAGVDTAVLLRNTLSKVGVEMWFKIYSPNVVGVEVIWRRPKRARRARLTYMRRPKHDMGNVDHLVEAWRRTRNVFSSKAKAKAGANTGRPGKRAGGRR